MNSGKDLASWVLDLLIVVVLIAVSFIYRAPACCLALIAYGVFRHIYAAICTCNTVPGARFLCDQPFWNLLDLAITGTAFLVGFHFASATHGFPYILGIAYAAFWHIMYACIDSDDNCFRLRTKPGYQAMAQDSGSPQASGQIRQASLQQLESTRQVSPTSLQEVTAVALDFVVLLSLVLSIFKLVDPAFPDAEVVTHEYAMWAVAAMAVYAVFRHIFQAVCIGNDVPGAGYLNEQLFYNCWDLVVIGTCFTAGIVFSGSPGPMVTGALLIILRFILWGGIKCNYTPAPARVIGSNKNPAGQA